MSERKEWHYFVVSVLKYLLHSNNSASSILLSLVHNAKCAFPYGLDYGITERRFLCPVLVFIQSMHHRTFIFMITFKQELHSRRMSQQMQ